MRQTIARATAVVLVLLGTLLAPGSLLSPREVTAQVMSDYTASPPFISNVVTPNILLLLDTSSSMLVRAYCESTDEPGKDDFDNCAGWDQNTVYSGLFDEMSCYTYDSGATRFEITSSKAAISSTCATTEWDGNMLNWVATRRFDAAKKVMIGGMCAVARNAAGTCPPSGSPAKITIRGEYLKLQNCCSRVRTPGVTAFAGRVPTAVQPGAGSTMYFSLPHPDATNLLGSFCTDNDDTRPATTATSCADGDGDAYAEQKFMIRVVVPSEATGVIQAVGDKARFGLAVFKGAEGSKVLTGIGSRQTMNQGIQPLFADTGINNSDTNTAAMVYGVNEATTGSKTPLAESLYDAVRYVAQVNSAYYPGDYVYPLGFSPAASFGSSGVGSLGSGELSALTGTESCPAGYLGNACGRDPYFFGSNTPAWASPSAQAVCCQTYVIIFTDGEPTEDQGIPAALQDYAHGQHGLHCTGGDTTIHAPNGTCNTNPATPPATLLGEHRTDLSSSSNGSHYMDDVAYWAHTNDLRQATIPVINVAGHDLPGFQNVTLYTFFAFGNIKGREVLMQAAKLGGFEDKNGNNIPELSEYDNHNNLTGEAGADGVPDGYFESDNAEYLQDKLLATVLSILQKTQSGTAASVLASSTTGEGTAYQAYYYPVDVEEQVKWTGYFHSLFVDAIGNTREDTDGDGKQIYQNDKIVVTRFDTDAGAVLVDRYADANGDGKADSTSCSPCGGALKNLVPIWEAGKQLALKNSADRKILTWVDTDGDGLVGTGEQMAFSTANSTTLGPYLRAAATGTFTADNIINFIRGDQITGLRNRQLTVDGATKVWKLGDIVHSTPVIVGAPKERYDVIYGDSTYTAYLTKYKNRRMVAYVGANDGMLHAINAGFYHRGDDASTSSATEHGWFTRTATDNASGPLLGDEVWGFIPYHLLPQLLWLTREDYIHTYYVDLKPKVTDARIFTPDTDHPEGWGTILIGGFRMGGSCRDCPAGNGKEMKFNPGGGNRVFYSAYFVLDITNPEADPKLLWSFTDEKLGLTTSYPTVLRVNPTADAKTSDTNAKWFAVFGSGPTGYDASVNSILLEATLYAVDLKTGPGTAKSKLITFDPTGKSKSFVGDLISLDANLDYRTDVVYAGFVIGDLSGTPKWGGAITRLTTGTNGPPPFGGETNAASWGQGKKPTFLLDDFPCSTGGCTGSNIPGPIAAAPTVTLDDAGNIWVFVGTGRLFHRGDQGNTETQYLFGVKDEVLNGMCNQNSGNNCTQKDLVNVSATVVCSTCASGTNQVTDSNNTGVTTLTGTATTSLQGLVASREGWYTTLPTSKERALVSPTLFGGIVLFPAYVPEGAVCVSGTGSSTLYALFYLTGSAYKVSVVGTDTVGGNANVKRSTSLGSGMASQIGIHMGAQGTDTASGITSRVKACSQLSTGALTCIQTQPALDSWSRYLSWINLRL